MFKNVYYWIYTNFRNTKTNDTPAITSLVMLTILEGINLASIIYLLKFLLKLKFSGDFALILGLSVYSILIIIGYFIFYRKRDEIVQNHENKTPRQKLWSKIFFWIYIIVTCVVFYIAGKLIDPNL